MENQLYIRIRGRILGPYDREKLRLLTRRGQFGRMHEVSQDGMTWFPASTCAELFGGDRNPSPSAEMGASPQFCDGVGFAGPLPQDSLVRHDRPWAYLQSHSLAIGLAGIAALSLVVAIVWIVYASQSSRRAAEERAVAEKKAGEEKAATEKEAAEEKAAVEQKAAEEKAAAERKVAGEKAAAEKKVAGEKAAAEKKAAEGKAAEEKAAAENKPATLTSIKDHAGIADAVGKVVIGVSGTDYFGKQSYGRAGAGSAFAITHDGAMITNKHVVKPCLEWQRADDYKNDLKQKYKWTTVDFRIWVFVNRDKYDARIVHVSSKNDYAILRVQRRFSRPFRLKHSAEETMDAEVRAIGFPEAAAKAFTDRGLLLKDISKRLLRDDIADCFDHQDLQYTMTAGRISQVAEALKVKWFQHDAGTAPGSSGGPLVLTDATVLGVNTLVAQDQRDGKSFGAQWHRALLLGQFRDDIDKHVSGIVWVP